MHNGSLMRYDPMNADGPVIRITDAWPSPGVQRFYVRRYPDGRSEWDEWDSYSYRDDLASAAQLAEEWLP
jgi:hypothetical protein